MNRRRLLGLVVLVALVPSAPASAHNVTATITPHAGAVVEDADFAINFAGDATTLPDGKGELDAKIRPGIAAPCASTASADPGDDVYFYPYVKGTFSVIGNYKANNPGVYRVCAWVEDA